jgi:hypothetical protein
VKRFEARRALEEALSTAVTEGKVTSAQADKLRWILMVRPFKRRAVLDRVEEHVMMTGLVEEDGTYGSPWLLIIQALIAFLPLLLDLLDNL